MRIKKTVNANLRVICVVPFPQQADGWSQSWRERYHSVLKHAQQIVVLAPHYIKGCFHQRNRYMVDHARALLAAFNGEEHGGTAYTIRYALKTKKEVDVIHPVTFQKTKL